MIRHLNIYCPKCSGPWSARLLRVAHFDACDSRAHMRPSSTLRPVRALIVDLVARVVVGRPETYPAEGEPVGGES